MSRKAAGGPAQMPNLWRGKVDIFVGHFVANSTYFNHVNLLRKHLLCFLHTITTRRRRQRRRRPSGAGQRIARPRCSATNFNFNLATVRRPQLHSKFALYSPPHHTLRNIHNGFTNMVERFLLMQPAREWAWHPGRLKKRVVSHFSADSLTPAATSV